VRVRRDRGGSGAGRFERLADGIESIAGAERRNWHVIDFGDDAIVTP